MSVSNVSLNPGVSQGGWKSSAQQALQDFDQLFQAMQAGTLSSAQQAYSALQQLAPNTSQTSTAAAATPSSLATDWSSLGQALQSGSLTSSQDAFTKLQQDLAAVGQGPQHAHHHQLDKAQAFYSAMQPGSEPSPAGAATSAVSADLNALKQALQSGNATSAEDILAKLEQDLKASGTGSVHHHRHSVPPQTAAASYASAAAVTATPAVSPSVNVSAA